ncbi:hypothetical protein ANSO36C_41560 [Nostoc cf. commune SO-36]|uniref:Uncharacterized protein n=1 Tax=Nostoc cf. commune SO-36 TaxID=449208 RepID=A0ABN6Q6A7_NOSCO|nr:hypothetical protein [Nostoc commune]BDI18354.1 hypothetical protein ANSO36C_41560 [Nostoc cf. commune SO-36]
MPTYLLLDPSSINALIIITLLFEILTLLRVVKSLDSIFYEPVLNNACCVGVARRRHRYSIRIKEREKGDRFSVTVEKFQVKSQEYILK